LLSWAEFVSIAIRSEKQLSQEQQHHGSRLTVQNIVQQKEASAPLSATAAATFFAKLESAIGSAEDKGSSLLDPDQLFCTKSSGIRRMTRVRRSRTRGSAKVRLQPCAALRFSPSLLARNPDFWGVCLRCKRRQNQAKDIKTKRYGKDIDQIHEELKRQAEGLPRIRQTDTTVPELESDELPGGQYLNSTHSRSMLTASQQAEATSHA
jgi:hypothetical protein